MLTLAALVLAALAVCGGCSRTLAGAPTTPANSSGQGDLGGWAGGSPDLSVPVVASAFRFGTAGAVGVSPNSPLVRLTPQSGCGTCLEVVCSKPSTACVNPAANTLPSAVSNDTANATSNVLSPGRLILTVADTCLSCGPLDLNLHADAFAKLANPAVGIINVTYRQIPCPSFGRNMSVYVSAFRASQGGYLRLSVRDVASDGLAEVAVAHCPRPQDDDGGADVTGSGDTAANSGATPTGVSSTGVTRTADATSRSGGLIPGCAGTLRGPIWRVMDNSVGAAWEYSGLPRLPLDLRLTGVGGQELIVWNAITNTTAPAVYRTRNQFSPVDPLGDFMMRAMAAATMMLAALALWGSWPCSLAAATEAVNSTVLEDLGAWAGSSPDLSAPVTAGAFRFGTAGAKVVLANNSCEYGPLTSPYIVGISPNSPLAKLRTQSGCGTCIELVCVEVGGGGEVGGGEVGGGEPSAACVHPEASTLPPAATDLISGAPSNVLSPGRLVLTVVDTCETCGPLDLNIPLEAYQQLGNPALANINVTYRQVACPSFGRNMSVYVSDFRASQGGYVRLSVHDVASDGLAEVAVAHCPRTKADNDTAAVEGCTKNLRGPIWRVMNNTAGAAWEYSGLPKLPLDLRLTGVGGEAFIVWNAVPKPKSPALYSTTTQFPPGDALAAAPTEEATAAPTTAP
ncbi:hypothetical protein TSOC_009509 [Tetrabaena socialis]|uniref:Expansin-like EG45 domain-containing protein n=1 Tax=Tetrabaena socialis TaxID=47790 RepID=A0A2J7ZVQ2_9CHLO|nr:hypothetical protein TSOC_009509 [Tetrabaena socialis]|eukprot:PNH04335.1 hypothetical protein TSOC_009509 [Tetrabaena socialis]